MNTSKRRHHHKRMEQKASFILIACWCQAKDEWYENQLKRMTTTRCRCSCAFCGNPRRVGWDNPLTMPERKADLSFKQQLAEL